MRHWAVPDGLAEWEERWLRWAWPIAAMATDCRDKFALVQRPIYREGRPLRPRRGKRPSERSTLPWPRYVGADWTPCWGALFVGSVHSNFTKIGVADGDADRLELVKAMADANRSLACRPELRGEQGLPRRHPAGVGGLIPPGGGHDLQGEAICYTSS